MTSTPSLAILLERFFTQRLMQQRHRLRQIDDVNVVAGAEDERRHLRIPAMGLMTKMHASL